MSDFEEKLNEVLKMTNTSNISELSKILKVTAGTIRSWRARGKIPKDAYRKAELIEINSPKNLFKVSKETLKNHLMEGLFRAVQVRGIALADDVRIGSVADILIDEIENIDPSFFTKPSKNIG
ncbi:MAG: MerR family transcriptional regulator [Colwellia sp.]|nr:MerR family transcriptional regulator [Colwellia sp.]